MRKERVRRKREKREKRETYCPFIAKTFLPTALTVEVYEMKSWA